MNKGIRIAFSLMAVCATATALLISCGEDTTAQLPDGQRPDHWSWIDRGIGWSPNTPKGADRIVVWGAQPGFLHWGINGWQRPPESVWPAGTKTAGDKAVETPLAELEDGKWGVTLKPLGAGVRTVDFVMHYEDGSWVKNGKGDFQIFLVGAGTDTPGPDAGQAGPDAGQQAGEDASVQAGAYAGQQAGPDAGQQAGLDAGGQAGPDAGGQAGPDAGGQAGEDAGSTQQVTVRASPAGGTFRGGAGEGVQVTLYVSGAESGTYTVEGESAQSYTNNQVITFGASMAENTSKKLTLSASNGGVSDSKEYTFTKQPPVVTSGYYATNPGDGKGQYVSGGMLIDGQLTGWTSDMLIVQGVANDDARIFKGSHEGPVYDLYALYAAWDDANLYLLWQYSNVTDVTDPSQGYPTSDNGKPYNGDIPIAIAFDVDPSKETDGLIDGTENSVWANIKANTYANGVDHLAMMSSKPGVGKPAVFKMNANGSFDYVEANVLLFSANGIEYKYGDGCLPTSLWGIKDTGNSGNYTPADLSDESRFVDLKTQGHDPKHETFYEIKIPLTVFGINKAHLESEGIGVMVISTFGTSGINSLPHDACVLDNAMQPYSSDASTSHEKEDNDNFTEPLARIGK